MADAALFIGWGSAVRGREQQALRVFDEAVQYYSRLQQAGQIQSFEPVGLEAHGGELAGFFLVRGDHAQLARVHASEEFERLTNRAVLVVEHFGVVQALLGEELKRMYADFGAQAAELAGAPNAAMPAG